MPYSNRFSVHRALGGGAVADLLLWKKRYRTAVFVVASTAIWMLFEIAGYNILSFLSNVLFLLIVILFFWAKSASLLNRPLPPVPNFNLSEDTVVKIADEMRVWVNYLLSIGHDIAIQGDLRLFAQVTIGLWVISYLGSLFNFLTLVYICILLISSGPVIYDKYQSPIDEKLSVVHSIAMLQYRKFDDKILQKIPPFLNKDKKMQ